MPTPESPPRGTTRRQVITLGLGLFAIAVVPRALRRARRHLATRSIPVMGTVAELAVVHQDLHQAEEALDLALARLRWVDRTMTRFDPASDVGRVNHAAFRDAVGVHGATALVVAEALRWAEATDGAFDPTLARVAELWDVGRRTAPPPAAAYRRLADRHGYRAVTVDQWRGRPVIRLTDPEVGLDLGGIAKGYAVDLAVETLRAAGIRSAVVNAGGDLYAMGRSADGDPWRVGIRSPDDPSRIAGVLELTDRAVATSGDYFQGFDYRGRRYHHILDGTTAEPRVAAVHSITVAADRCLAADAAATAAFGLPAGRVREFLGRRAPGAEVLSTI